MLCCQKSAPAGPILAAKSSINCQPLYPCTGMGMGEDNRGFDSTCMYFLSNLPLLGQHFMSNT